MRKTANEIRDEICRQLRKAWADGMNQFTIRAGDIDDVNLPNVCQAMRGSKIETPCEEFSVKILKIKDNKGRIGTDARASTNFWVTYELIANVNPKLSMETREPSENVQSLKSDTDGIGSDIVGNSLSLRVIKQVLRYLKDEGLLTEDQHNNMIKEIFNRL